MRIPDPFRHARDKPLQNLLLSLGFLFFWALFPLTEFLEGAFKVPGGDLVTIESEPVRFWLIALAAGGATVFVLCNLAVAADSLLNRDR